MAEGAQAPGAAEDAEKAQQQEDEEPRPQPQPQSQSQQQQQQQQREQREHEEEPEAEQQHEKEPKKKRKRRTIACLQCRTRKVRCDLEFPSCGRCAKGPWPDACVYENAGPTTWSSTGTLPATRSLSNEQSRSRADADGRDVRGDASSSRLSEEQRIRELERVVLSFAQSQAYAKQGMAMGRLHSRAAADSEIQHTPSPRSTQYSRDEAGSITTTTTTRPDAHSRPLLGVKGNRTRFYGLSNVASLVTEFGDLRAYTKDLKSRFPALANIRNLKALKKDLDQIRRPLSGESALDAVFLTGLLPARPVTYNLVQYYFAFSSSTYHVLHKQTFYERLQDLYQHPQQAAASFVVQLLLVLSIVWSVDAPEPVAPSSDKSVTVTRNMAMEWIHWGDTWLFHSGIKRPNMVLLQTRCLLVLAKDANYTQKNQAWAATGTIVKLAMSAGYHRELGPDAKVSHFDREMRRRIWSTIVELDLNASFDRGMPPTIQAVDYDALPPININDEDITESSTQYPEPKHWQIPTDSSFQVTLARSVDLRLRICALVNAPRIAISAAQLSELDDELTRHLSEVPRTWESFESTDLRQRQRVMLWRALIDTQLRRSQLCLHSCCALSDFPPSVSNYSWRARLEVAMELLCQQHQVVEQLGRLAWPLLTNTTFQAALTLCHYMYRSDRGFASYLIQATLPAMTESLIALVEKTLPHLESKFLILEKGIREYCYFCFIISMVKTKRWPESALSHQRLAVDRITSMCYSILSRGNGDRTQDGDIAKASVPSVSSIEREL
ncbi:hypothetical protein TRV_05175 [Trichophyton verrucosum HKI 0517]|uniref:Zn(2)-C6 fungal-type domain-containing protein n=1 Tax=Trichophyton verrucosum (strain HKI 0517) TaxID=663202 RepID=D4DDG4_TRIVH|nr:uncharacterized protein TRV_05175 [Trichophyton verrucosum HKI 0517]EFE40106.1 hypothetical protein TRV_05175 [Trichophyton verrucosum HKI 0517]